MERVNVERKCVAATVLLWCLANGSASFPISVLKLCSLGEKILDLKVQEINYGSVDDIGQLDGSMYSNTAQHTRT